RNYKPWSIVSTLGDDGGSENDLLVEEDDNEGDEDDDPEASGERASEEVDDEEEEEELPQPPTKKRKRGSGCLHLVLRFCFILAGAGWSDRSITEWLLIDYYIKRDDYSSV
ncbi:hypothetical protein BHE74_00053889, partial [Ensete ventricosum]